jgi:novobiocin biosynthesis protein NovU/D-mycarose 3-C-methyltransferase
MKEVTEIVKCPITDDSEHITYFDLGDFPLVNNLCDTKEESINCKRFPLRVNLFTKSNLSTLSHSVNSELMFSNYLFKSEVNVPYIKHCERMFDYISGLTKLNKNDSIVDIGGNDGTLLDAFKRMTNIELNYLNIDPSKNLVKLSEEKGIPVLNDYFSLETAKNIDYKVKIVTSTNVFQHLRDTNSFADGVYHLLEDDGLWLLEFPYWIHDLETNQFDQIYHEHVYYYSVTALQLMMEKHGFKIIRAEKQNIHGGTLRLVMAKQTSNIEADDSLDSIIENEKNYDLEYYKNWGNQVYTHLDKCKDIIKQIKSEGKNIVAFGAAAKGCIFLNACGITDSEIDFIIDDTDIKQGKYMPGTCIKIVGREFVNFKEIDYIVVLAHNFADYIIDSFKNNYEGKFITFLPEIKII